MSEIIILVRDSTSFVLTNVFTHQMKFPTWIFMMDSVMETFCPLMLFLYIYILKEIIFCVHKQLKKPLYVSKILEDFKFPRDLYLVGSDFQYRTFKIHWNDYHCLTFTHCSHVIWRNCGALLYCMHRLNKQTDLNEKECGW